MRVHSLSLTALAAVAVMLTVAPAFAADLALPAPSPLARVMQTIGVTEVTVEYSSPGVKGRKIFGELLKFGELWRTGANGATKITFTNDVTVGGKAVPTGTYAIFTIPGKDQWTVILNKNAMQGGTRNYDKTLDQARITVKPAAAPARERLTFLIADTTDDSARLDLEWETTRISLPIKIDTDALAKKNIEAAHRSAWRELASAARYLLDAKDNKGALKLIDASLSIEQDFYNAFIKARILNAAGDAKGAKQWAQKAQDLGKKASYFFWKDQVADALKGKW